MYGFDNYHVRKKSYVLSEAFPAIFFFEIEVLIDEVSNGSVNGSVPAIIKLALHQFSPNTDSVLESQVAFCLK